MIILIFQLLGWLQCAQCAQSGSAWDIHFQTQLCQQYVFNNTSQLYISFHMSTFCNNFYLLFWWTALVCPWCPSGQFLILSQPSSSHLSRFWSDATGRPRWKDVNDPDDKFGAISSALVWSLCPICSIHVASWAEVTTVWDSEQGRARVDKKRRFQSCIDGTNPLPHENPT